MAIAVLLVGAAPVRAAAAPVRAAAADPGASDRADQIAVYDSSREYKVEPRNVDLDGMPGPWLFSKLVWRSWGGFKAESKMARMRVNSCKPACAAGNLKAIKARLTLSHPRTCRGHRVYSKAVLDPKRGGFAPVGTDIPPKPTLALEITCDGYVLPW